MSIEETKFGFIYITTNLINGKRYIGKKVFDNLGKWKTYLGSGIGLKRAVKKYGKRSFRRNIIDYALDDEELCLKERFWIDFYNAVSDQSFYNIAAGGDGGKVRAGYSKSNFDISEKKRIDAIRKHILKGENAVQSRLKERDVVEIISRLKNNDFSTDIARDYHVSYQTIDDIRKHKTWKHLTGGIEFEDISHRGRNIESKKQIAQFDKNMNFIASYSSGREASKETGVSYKLISQVCNGGRKSTHGYIFKFA